MRVWWRGVPVFLQGGALVLVGVVIGSLLTSSLSIRSPPQVLRDVPLLCPPCDCSTSTAQHNPATKGLSNKGLNDKLNKSPISSISNTTYLHPPSSEVKGREPLKRLSEEYVVRTELTVAVLTNQDHLNMANAVFDTWGQSTNQIAFFVGEDCDVTVPMATGLPLVKVPGVKDSEVNSVKKTFQVLQYLSDNYLQSSKWFLLATDNVYIRLNKLERLLQSLDSTSLVYMGHSGNGRLEDSDKLSLLPHEHYCLGRTGVVLSGGLLAALSGHLEACMSGALSVGSGGVGGTWADVELGRCVSRTTGTQCSGSTEARGYFRADYSGVPPSLGALDSQQFNSLISYHPVNDVPTLHTLHHHYSQLAFKASLETTHRVHDLATSTCHTLASLGGITTDLCPPPLCDCPLNKCPPTSLVNDPPKSFQPSNIYDYLSWQYFDDRTLYSDKVVHPSTSLQQGKDTRKELQVMLGKAVQSASERFGHNLKFKRLLNGWVRHNPFRGSEYIVDCLFTDSYLRTVPKRVSLVRPLAANYITLKDSADTRNTVNFLVPLSNVNERFTEFMSMYETIALKSEEAVRLILSVYGSKDVSFVEGVLDEYRAKYPQAAITVVPGQGDFSRGKALHLAMTKLHSDELAFVCDVDMSVSEQFINRCRRNTLQGKRVYYPEFFKLYNLDYVYRNRNYPNRVAMKRKHGHWAYYSFGMLCIYKSDYTSVGGMNTNIVGWGEEDVKFFEKVVRKKLEVLRSPDTGLSHRWHEKSCPNSLSKTQFIHCLSSRGENLADRIELASFIYEKGVQLQYKEQGMPHSVQLSNNQTINSDYPLET